MPFCTKIQSRAFVSMQRVRILEFVLSRTYYFAHKQTGEDMSLLMCLLQRDLHFRKKNISYLQQHIYIAYFCECVSKISALILKQTNDAPALEDRLLFRTCKVCEECTNLPS